MSDILDCKDTAVQNRQFSCWHEAGSLVVGENEEINFFNFFSDKCIEESEAEE